MYCPKCGRMAQWNSWYDTGYCEECDIWTEQQCSCKGDSCSFSVDSVGKRPEKPSEAKV
jgi:hypothetical protein